MDMPKDFGENERDKDNRHGGELALLHLHVGYLFETGYYKEPEAYPTRDFPRI
jgi:hypothetical protein